MTKSVTISLVTSCFNAAELLPVTLRSIRQQSLLLDPKASFEYIIVDAASTDQTLEVIREVAADLPITLISEPDQGLYDGLAKGFTKCRGDIVGYINAGDFLFPGSLEVIRDAFTDTTAAWMTGYNTLGNNRWQPTRVELPFRYRREFFLNGVHGTSLPTLQQESTFWRRELMDDLDWAKFRSMKLAGDFFLWQHFSQVEAPAVLHSLVGAFCAHPGQLSSDYSKYLCELQSLCRIPSLAEKLLAVVDRILWKAPHGVKRRLAGGRHITYDDGIGRFKFN
jgi:glycosyltransferase involved in cell wall biosynthesis